MLIFNRNNGLDIIRVAMWQNLSLWFPTKWDSNQPAQLQSIARKLKFLIIDSPFINQNILTFRLTFSNSALF